MRNMKLMTAALIMALSIGVTACGSSKPSGTITTQEETQTERVKLEEEEAEETEAEDEEDVEDVEEEEVEEEETEEELSLGEMSGKVYTNEFFDIRLELPADWDFASEEEVEEVNAAVLESLNSQSDFADAMEDALSKGNTYVEMIAYQEDGIANINLTISKLSPLERISYARGSLVADLIDESGDEMKDMYENVYGMEEVSFAEEKCNFRGEEVSTMLTSASTQGIPVYMRQTQIVEGGYMATVTVTCYLADETQEILAEFQTVK